MANEITNALKRTTRTQLTKCVNCALDLLDNDEATTEELRVALEKLKLVNHNLSQITRQSLNEIPTDQLDEECNKMLEYEDNATTAILRIEQKLKKMERVPVTTSLNDLNALTPLQMTGQIDDENRSQRNGELDNRQHIAETSQRNVPKTIKLPRLELRKFDGSLKQWPPFWEQFQLAVHENAELDNVIKFQYLQSALTGRAAASISGLAITQNCYNDAIELLKNEYGNQDQIVDSYIQQLLRLPEVKNKNDVQGLRGLYNVAISVIRSLDAVGISSNQYCIVVKSILLKAIPYGMRIDFNRTIKGDSERFDRPLHGSESDLSDTTADRILDRLLSFIKLELESVELAQGLDESHRRDSKRERDKNIHKCGRNKNNRDEKTCTVAGLFSSSANDNNCSLCKSKVHRTKNCDNSLTITEKKNILRAQKRCFKCTGSNHDARNCRTQNLKCQKCNGKHATTMCDPNFKRVSTQHDQSRNAPRSEELNPENTTNLISNSQLPNVYLQTARALLINENEQKTSLIRIVLDGGSQLSFIKESVSREYGLPVVGKHKISIFSFGSEKQNPSRLCNVVCVTLKGQYSNEIIKINAVEIPEICFDALSMPPANDPAFRNLRLADICVSSDVQTIPGVSMLIGADNYWRINSGQTIRFNDKLTAIDTKFGWTIQGPMNYGNSSVNCALTTVLHSQTTIESDIDLKQLWDLDSIGIRDNEENNKSFTEDFVENKISFENERYTVSLPWKDENSVVQPNYHGALCRLNNLTKKLIKEHKLKEYDNAVREYMKCDFAEEAPAAADNDNSRLYFMPHRPVYRNDKETTKTRVVFDASAHGYQENSLNDLLYKGDNLVPLLLKILLNFRIGRTALVSDIEKAFLQISLDERDRDSHSFLWYAEPISECHTDNNLPPIKRYRMKRVSFGVTCSPFLLSAVITHPHHLDKMKDEFDNTCKIMQESFYVDDLVTSVSSSDSADTLYKEANFIMSKAGMHLTKWRSNDPDLRQRLEETNTPADNVKVLGTQWSIISDQLSVDLHNILTNDSPPTKRIILQVAARIFDVLGIPCPFTLKPKLILQDLWKLNLTWDAVIPPEIVKEWNNWTDELINLTQYKIPRCCVPIRENPVELHIFADASLRAYGCVAYIQYTTPAGEKQCSFYMAKNRISPINKRKVAMRTLPELELTAILCAVKLHNFIAKNVRVSLSDVTIWSDSQIALFWLRNTGSKQKQKPYVCHRVDEICRTFSGKLKFIPGQLNPADIVTRPISAKMLLQNDVWLNGPEILRSNQLCTEDWTFDNYSQDCVPVHVNINPNSEADFETTPLFELENMSSLEKVFRVTAYILRFVKCVKKLTPPRNETLNRTELREAEKYWIKLTQRMFFKDELGALQRDQPVDRSSSILLLNPFLDDDGILRLQGRLQMSDLPYEVKHPIILPKSAELTKMIIWESHARNMHSGVNATLAFIRRKFWIIAGRQKIKSVLSKCVKCKKLKGKHGDEVFAPLPRDRLLRGHKAFCITGADFFGPLYVSNQNVKTKVYVLLFTCAVSRAVHLELVLDQSTENCIRALRRFVSRRGVPDTIISDNSKTFKRCAIEIRNLCALLSENEVQNFAARLRIKWKFIVERAPWWGGFWERLIRTIKNALKITLSKALLCTAELETVLTEIEAVINSRPLTYIESDPDNLHVLSPSDILIGTNNTGFNVGFETDSSRNDILKLWNLRNKLSLKFWKRWSNDYLQQLSSAHKIKRASGPKFETGDIAVLHDDNIPRVQWKLVRLINPIMGRDGKVRAYEVKTSNGACLRRPIQLLYPLEVLPSTPISPAPEDVKNLASV